VNIKRGSDKKKKVLKARSGFGKQVFAHGEVNGGASSSGLVATVRGHADGPRISVSPKGRGQRQRPATEDGLGKLLYWTWGTMHRGSAPIFFIQGLN